MKSIKEQLQKSQKTPKSSISTSKQKTIENLIQQIENAKMANDQKLVRLIQIVLKRVQDIKEAA
jgi:hypothetical protein